MLDQPKLRFHPYTYCRILTPPWPGDEQIDPATYFITSGEAEMKTNQLRKDIIILRNRIFQHDPTPRMNLFGLEIREALDGVDRLLAEIRRTKNLTRPPSVHLECIGYSRDEEEDNPVIVATCKNPRPRDDGPREGEFSPRKWPAQRSKFRGVTFYRRGRGTWHAQISIEGRNRSIGYFATEEEAARRYDEVAIERDGADAILNFPPKLGNASAPIVDRAVEAGADGPSPDVRSVQGFTGEPGVQQQVDQIQHSVPESQSSLCEVLS